MRHFDYIFAGGGMAAMMVLVRLQENGMLAGKRTLVIDPDPRESNDRTWCFWDRTSRNFIGGPFREWNYADFIAADSNVRMALAPYSYKMVRGMDFFANARNALDGENIIYLHEKVVSWRDTGRGAEITAESETFQCNILFNSIFDEALVLEGKVPYLRQHFVGWTVRTQNPVFNPGVPVFMDFSIAQKGNTRFMYVLPISQNEALLEYTLFSKDLLPESEYESAIAVYLGNLGAGTFKILEKERGAIPMTVYPFHKQNSAHIAFIGSAGGWTKPSTGYTYRNSTLQSKKIVDLLKSGKSPVEMKPKARFTFYDALLIDVLFHENAIGSRIFNNLFRDGNPAAVFKFLDEETTLSEDLKIVLRCPKAPFLRALWRHMTR